MSNVITIKPTSPNKQNYAFVDVVDSIFRASTVMDIAPRVRFAKIDGVGTLILDKALIDGITLVSLKKDEVATVTTDAELSYKDTYLVQEYTLGRAAISFQHGILLRWMIWRYRPATPCSSST